MRSPITEDHKLDAQGRPAGGSTSGRGISISWQNGPLSVPAEGIAPGDCPTPVYHETHRYCPSCTWTEEGPATVRREPNGAFVEDVIAAAVGRLRFYQEGGIKGGVGRFACRENALALTHLEEALHWLDHRTRDREARGVEGTHEV